MVDTSTSHHISNLVKKWMKSVSKLRFASDLQKEQVMGWTGHGAAFWSNVRHLSHTRLLGLVEKEFLNVLNQMHTSKRDDYGRSFSEHRDRIFKSLYQGKIGDVIRSLL